MGERKFTLALSEEQYKEVKELTEKHGTTMNSVVRLGARLAIEADRADTGEEGDGLFFQKDGKEYQIIPGW